MKHKAFRKDLEYIYVMMRQLRVVGKESKEKRSIEKIASIVEEKLDDIVKDVYSGLIEKGEWLDNQNKELPI